MIRDFSKTELVLGLIPPLLFIGLTIANIITLNYGWSVLWYILSVKEVAEYWDCVRPIKIGWTGKMICSNPRLEGLLDKEKEPEE